jgi:hypothetical protein
MRLLTHNTLRNNSAAAKGLGYPLRIAATEIRVDDNGQHNRTLDDAQAKAFVQSVLTTLDWSSLVTVRVIKSFSKYASDEQASVSMKWWLRPSTGGICCGLALVAR